MAEFDHVTTQGTVDTFLATRGVFDGLLKEVRELSKKKPEATMSASKVKLINRVLDVLLVFLKQEPEGKFLERIDEDALPQVSDAVLIMVQFEAALSSFHSRYFRYANGSHRWITKEQLAVWGEGNGHS